VADATDSGRVALVTGGARGIGRAIAQALVRQGHRVVVADRQPATWVSEAAAPDAQRLHAAVLDVTDRSAIRALRDQTLARWGPVAILVNNAAISPKQADGYSAGVLDISPSEWESVLQVNLTAALVLCQEFLPGMKALGWGRVVNMASLAGRTKSISAGASYMASKAGLIGLTRAIATEMGPFGITANCVAPGRVVTEMSMTAGVEANAKIAQQLPVRRLGQPEEVAEAVVYLSGPLAGFVNGAVIDINGGIYMP
jgi:3-oxoacyl-[acyl-carrier protein] reductase